MPPFEKCMDECKQYFELGVRSQFDQAIEKLGQCSPSSIYHISTQLYLSGIKHMLTLNKVNFLQLKEEYLNILDLLPNLRSRKSMGL